MKDTPAWAERFVNERGALVAAAAWFMRHGEHASATELAANVWRVWVLARDDANGRAFLAGVLDAPGASAPTRFRALALYGDGLFAFRLGALAESRARNAAALDAARIAKDREAEGLAFLGLSRVDLSDGRGAEARERAAEARALLRAFEAAYDQAPLHMLAQATRLTGALDEAAALFDDSLALNRKLGDRGMVIVELHNLGHVELRRGNVDKAERCFEECAALAGNTDDPYDLALRAFNSAAVALARDDTARAKMLLEEARAILARDATKLASDDAREFDELERRIGR
jgi:tetratricopeptide (TPR) repeat protein